MYPWFSQLQQQLSARLHANKLHHALLFLGPEGLGKHDFALEFAHFVLCANKQGDKQCGQCQSCLLSAANNHPDLHIVESEKQIGVDLIREAIKKLSGSAHLLGAKVLIIAQADSMTESSANALLKTLEEPTANTYLMLTTDKAERILPTIKSRCEKLALPLPNLATTLEWVKNHYSAELDMDLAKLFSQRPLALLRELKAQEQFSYAEFSQNLQKLSAGQLTAVQLASQWQEQVEKVLKWSQYWLRQQCTTSAENDQWHASQLAIKATKQLRNPGVNKILLLTQLLEKLAKLNPIPTKIT